MADDFDLEFRETALEMCVRLMPLIEANRLAVDKAVDLWNVETILGVDPVRETDLAFRTQTLMAAGDALNLALSAYGKLVP